MCLNRLTKSIRMGQRVYSINNKFLDQKGLLRLCKNLAAKRTYKIYQNDQKDLLNQ